MATETPRWLRPVDGASLRAFRVLFGALMLIAVVRFFAHGWIDSYFHEPQHTFHYPGFEWVRPWPRPWMHVHFAVMGVAAFLVMIGYRHRIAAVVLGVLFAYAHLCDVTNYLNHYYLLIQVSFLLALLPATTAQVPAWTVWAVRAQVGLVYFFGGVAKLSPDWLAGQPLTTWLQSNADLPLLGALFADPTTGVIASWMAALFDLTIVGWLLWRRSRPYAFAAVVVFHVLTAQLFHLGLFPWAMIAFATIFFAPDWPRRFVRPRPAASRAELAGPPVKLVPVVIAVHLAIQVLLPWRAYLHGGVPLWHEQGFRFAWKVMLMEKSGVVEFLVRDPDSHREWRVPASRYYTRYQGAMMATQPDLILQAAHVVADDFRRRGVAAPEIYADSFVSLNGRPRQRFIDPAVDLVAELDRPWILPAPEEPPP